VEQILGKEGVESVRYRDMTTNQVHDLSVTGFFVAIGHQPNTSIFKGQLKMNDAEYLVVEPGTTKTNIPGVFAAGDVADHVYRQAVTAAGTGCMAAIDAERYLEGHA
jgi:thioredoxin reductase (NADPH)